jgi:2-C-methyl-D-erythritol 4-phosphate cytidylyltransferase
MMAEGNSPSKRVRVVEGGNSRQQSVERARLACPDTDLVAVHDAVRPFIEVETIRTKCSKKPPRPAPRSSASCRVDTVKQVSQAPAASNPRHAAARALVLAQTPQVFRYELLVRAFELAREDGFTGTDESSLVERLDVEVSVVLGSDRNIKITKPGDMDLARLFFREFAAKESSR